MDDLLELEVGGELSLEVIDDLVADLEEDLNHSADLKATRARRPLREGERAYEALELGRLAVVLLSSHAITALVQGITRLINRDRTLTVEVADKSGRKVKIAARNVSERRVEEIAREIEKLLKAPLPDAKSASKAVSPKKRKTTKTSPAKKRS